MKLLLVFAMCLFLLNCTKSGNSNGGSSGSPTFSINDLPDITSANAGRFTVSGTCLEEGEPVAVVVGEGTDSVSPGTNPDCTNGAWTIDIDVTGLNKIEEVSVTADHSSATGSAHPQATTSVANEFICPENYVGVPALASYTTNSFCVMKYEAKNDGSNNAVSKASGTPYVNINRNDSINKCTSLGEGYDLITNDEWQSIARNIELVGDNWATGVVGNEGGLSSGHSDATPLRALAASDDDTRGCEGTGQNCSNTMWSDQRRTHTLSNGEVIWDIAGNVYAWVKDTNNQSYGSDTSIYQVTASSHSASNSLSGGTTMTARIAKDQFGPSGDYSSLNTMIWAGLGYGYLVWSRGGVSRGGYLRSEYSTAGVFEVNLANNITTSSPSIGFLCVFHP